MVQQPGAGENWIFTSYDRDSESGLDYALARYYDSRTGTFCSADPLAGDPATRSRGTGTRMGGTTRLTLRDPSGKNWFFSLMADVMIALAPFTDGATLPAAEALGAGLDANAFDNLANGQPPFGFNPFGGGVALGSSWNGTPENLPNPGLAGALGLPTMPGGPIINNLSPGGGASDFGNCLPNVGSFVNAHLQDAQTIAKSLGHGVTAAEVLATAGNETH